MPPAGARAKTTADAIVAKARSALNQPAAHSLPMPNDGPPEVLFHIGMGKTGTSSLQAALQASGDSLATAGQEYLGMWMGRVDPAFGNLQGFQKFLSLTPTAQAEAARQFAAALAEQARASGTRRFILSNEQYIASLERIRPFFKTLRDLMPVRLVAYVRHPAEWLPSACTQWGIVHKNAPGPVRDPGSTAQRLIGQYRQLLAWADEFAAETTLRRVVSGTDAVADFSQLIGVSLAAPAAPVNARRPRGELILRAAFADRFRRSVAPREFEATSLARPRSPLPPDLPTRFQHLFDLSGIDRVLAEERDLVAQIEAVCRLPPATPAPSPDYEFQAVAEDLIGRLVEVSAHQAKMIEELRDRIICLEKEQQSTKAQAIARSAFPGARLRARLRRLVRKKGADAGKSQAPAPAVQTKHHQGE